MEVYHGSYAKIDKIDLSKGQLYRDFGQGFYVTKIRKHAESWAEIIGRKYGTKGFVTEFTYYDTGFTERLCKVKHFEKYDEETASNIFYNSGIFAQLSDVASELHKKSWQEIYEMLMIELLSVQQG